MHSRKCIGWRFPRGVPQQSSCVALWLCDRMIAWSPGFARSGASSQDGFPSRSTAERYTIWSGVELPAGEYGS